MGDLVPGQAREGEKHLLNSQRTQVDAFVEALNSSLSRSVQGVTVIVLHGAPQQLPTVADAISYLHGYDDVRPSPAAAQKYEIDVRYNNGDVIHGVFQQKSEAVRFLQTFG